MNEGTDKSRLFVALPVPEDIARQAEALPRKNLQAKWHHDDDLHITLRFLGDVEENQIPTIKDALHRIRKNAFHVCVEGLGVFEKRHGGILWAAVASTKKVTALAADVNVAVEPLGFEMPRIPYVPHVTLARTNAIKGLSAYATQFAKRIKCEWQAREFILYRSAPPDEKGVRYQMLDKFLLN